MVLVDINSITPKQGGQPQTKQDEPLLVKALNSLITSNEYSRSEFGAKAKVVADLDKELKVILERTDLQPSEKIKLYNHQLQRYLHMVRSDGNNTPVNASDDVETQSEETDYGAGDVSMVEPNISRVSQPRRHSTSTLLAETPRSIKTPVKRVARKRTKIPAFFEREDNILGRKQYKNNLPRETPVRARLRTAEERRKNSRFRGFLSNWQNYGESE